MIKDTVNIQFPIGRIGATVMRSQRCYGGATTAECYIDPELRLYNNNSAGFYGT